MDGFGFDIGGAKKAAGGHKSSSHSHSHHHRRRHQGGGDFAPPSDDGGGDGGGGDDGSGGDGGGGDDDSGGDMGAECTCGGVCASCQAGGARRIGWRGHMGPDLYQSNHLAPMSGDNPDPGWSGQYGPDLYTSGYDRPMGEEEDDFGCDPLGTCGGAYAKMRTVQYGWEYDGPGVFGGDLSPPILSNWGRYPSRSPLKGVFAGDLSMPILSNWGRYPSRSPLKGVFAGDGDPMVMPMDTITASPPAPVQRINQDANPTTSGLGGVLDAINAVAAGTSSVIAAAKGPPPPPPPPPAGVPARPLHHHRRAQPMRPLPYYAGQYAYPIPESYSPVDLYGRPALAPAYSAQMAYMLALRANPYYRDPGY